METFTVPQSLPPCHRHVYIVWFILLHSPCLQIKQASDSAMIERRQFQGNGDFMDHFQGNFYLNGFVMKEVR